MKLPLNIAKALIAMIALSASLAAASACPKPLRVGLADRGYAAYRTSSGYAGMSVEIVNMASQRVGCRVEYVWLPSSRLMLELRNGHIDIAATMLHHPERDGLATFLPYAYTINYLVTPKQGHPYANFEQFMQQRQARLNVVRGLLPGPTVQANLPDLIRQGRVEEVNDYATLFRKMAAGRAEAAVMSPWVYLWYARMAGVESQFDVSPLTESPRLRLGMYVSTSGLSSDAVDGISAALRGMLADGSIQAIFENQLGPRLAKQLFNGGPGPLIADLNAVHNATAAPELSSLTPRHPAPPPE